VPVPLDDLGARPEPLAAALARGANAVILTPRAQAATGTAWDAERADRLAEVLRRTWRAGDRGRPRGSRRGRAAVVGLRGAGPVGGDPLGIQVARARPAAGGAGRDEATVSRVEGRQALGTGWVSYLLQEMVAELWADGATAGFLAGAAASYAERRRALQAALAGHGITATGRPG